jgi:LacI family transcriptional regulator
MEAIRSVPLPVNALPWPYGVWVIDQTFPNSFHSRILQGVQDCALELNQHVLFSAVHYSPKTPPHHIEVPSLLEERCLFDGLILAGVNYPNFLTRIRKLEIPFVVFGNSLNDFTGEKFFDQVSFDGFRGGLDAVRHVIGRGHRNIVFVGDLAHPWARIRRDAFLMACDEAQIEPNLITNPRPAAFVAYGEWASSEILARTPLPTAVIAVNDQVAYGLWRSFRQRGIQVPNDISLIGFADREEALLMDPPLTTVRVRKEEIGKACMRTLMERLNNPEMAFIERTLSTDLVVRETVKQL